MMLSDAGRKAIETREGYRTRAYQDTKGIWTIGVGHTGPEVVPGLVWTNQEVDDAFSRDVQWAVKEVNQVVMPLNQNMFDALVSFVFNIGAEAFIQSTMRKLLNLGLYNDAAQEFNKWNKPPEVLGRRLAEKAQFLTPI